MKKIIIIAALSFIIFPLCAFAQDFNKTPEGAWEYRTGGEVFSLMIADNYCMISRFDRDNKKFIKTWGGTCTISLEKLSVGVQFDSEDKTQCGKTLTYKFVQKGNALLTNISGSDASWKQVDGGKQGLAGNWRITQRKNNGEMADIPLRPRRTFKLLTANRFQWAAINIETCEFSGTGGGTYIFKDGKYTEHIEFFSRDNSRVGALLTFDGKLENGKWTHSGLSSKGDPIYEVWERFRER